MRPDPSRRGVLSLAGLLPLAIVPGLPAVAAEPDADRELITLCAEFDRLVAQWDETDFDAPVGNVEREQARDAEQARITEAQVALAARMHAIRPTTMIGHAARARSIVGWAPDLLETSNKIEDMLRSAIYRDLTDLPVTPACVMQPTPPAVPPEDVDHDKALMATCKQHVANLIAVNDDPNDMEDGHPVWDVYVRSLHTIDEAEPRTLAGIYAKARAARVQMNLPGGEREGPGPSWAIDIVNDLLRLVGEG